MANIAKLVSFLLRSSEKLHYSTWTVVSVIVAGVISGLASTGLLALINDLLHEQSATPSSLLGWNFALLCVALPASRFASQYLLLRLSQGIVYKLRVEMSRQILKAPLRRLEELGAPRLLAALTDDIGSLTAALSTLPLLSLHITVVLGCLTYLGWLSPQLLIGVLAVVALGVASYQLPVRVALRRFKMARETWDELFGHLRGLTSGTKELQMHARRREAFLSQLLRPAAEKLRRYNMAGGAVHALANSWGQILFFVFIGSLLFIVPKFLQVSPEVLTGYIIATLYMLTPLDVILSTIPGLARASVSVDKIEDLGVTLESMSDGAESRMAERPVAWSKIECVGVMHTYYRELEEDTFSLGPIDLSFRPGEVVFLVGGNGSGKTTLAKVLTGLYTPESGEILVDGERVTDEGRDAYRQLFSVVFSDFYLFDRLLGLKDAAKLDSAADGYLRMLQLEHKVRVEDGALSTLDLSQGQRKRLALLTAYLEDRPIYVFDEWAADQDPYFKDVFYRQLLAELKSRGKMVLVISHDDRYYRVADRIIKLEFGRIEEEDNVSEVDETMSSGDRSSGEPSSNLALVEH